MPQARGKPHEDAFYVQVGQKRHRKKKKKLKAGGKDVVMEMN